MRSSSHIFFKASALGAALMMAMNPTGALAEEIEETTGLVDYALGSKNHQPLSDYGVTHVEMPATPAKLWQIINSGRRAAAE